MIETENLRSRILSLAMRGELSERNLQDGSAAELYSKILETKAELVKSGKIRKDKQYDAIEAENMPYSIPDNWCWVRFGKIINLQSGQDLKPSEYNDKQSGIPYITGASNYESDGSIIINRWTDCPKAYAYEDDILLSCKGTVGKLTILREKEVHIARQIMGIRTFNVDVTFMFYYLQSMIYGIKEAQKGLIPGIERNDVLNLLCPLPPVPEQVRIVEKIEALFCELNKIDALQNQYTFNQEALKSKLIDAAIQGKLTEQLPEDGTAEELFERIAEEKRELVKEKKIKKEKALPPITENEIPFGIPGNWKWVRLSDISYRIWAGGDKPEDFSKESDDVRKVPVVANGVSNEGILGYTSKATATKNTITVAGRGTIGYTVLRRYDYCPIVRLIVIEQSRFIEPRYLQIFLQSMPEASVGSSIPQLTVPMIKPKLVPLPPLDEQLRISEKLSGLLEIMSEPNQ